jgi:glycosyltransferase involved in cell wall biosynthesis
MRVAIVAGPFVPIPPNKYGGIEQVIQYEIKGLKEAGHEPILLGTGDSSVDCELVPIVDKAIFFPHTKKARGEHKKLAQKADRTTARKLRELLPRIDVIHSHGFDLSGFANFPNVTTLHNKIQFEDLAYFLKRRQLNYVSISDSQQAVLPELRYAGTVYDGEDPESFPIVSKPDNYVCFLGRFDRDKSPHLAIQLAISLGVKIKLAGKIDHDSEGYFEEEVAKYFDHPLVEYLGELDFAAKIDLLSKAKCNLHPTNFREPFGLTVLEAAYCGTPTMAVARGSMPELIEPGRTGLLVEDFLEGRSLIEECYKMDRDYIAMRARQLFNYRAMADQYVEIFQRIIASTPDKAHLSQNIFQRIFGPLSDRITPKRTTVTSPRLVRKV